MQITIMDEGKDYAEVYDVLHLAKEKDGLLISTPSFTFFIDPFDSLAEAVVDLVGRPNLPEPRRPERVHSIEELLAAHAGSPT